MTSGATLIALFLDLGRRLKDRARLHLGDLRESNAQPAAAMPEHRIELMQLMDALRDLLRRHAELRREIAPGRIVLRQELVQRRVEQPDGGRASLERLEDADEVLLLVRQQLVDRLLARLEAAGQDHLADGIDAVALVTGADSPCEARASRRARAS